MGYGSLAVTYAHKELWTVYVDAVYSIISKGYARTNSTAGGFISAAVLITNNFVKVNTISGIRVKHHHSINEEGRAAYHEAGEINVIGFICAVNADLINDLQMGVRLRYISCTPADIF